MPEPATGLVTGAASGIGAATARRLAGEGVRLALLDIDERGVHEVAASLPGSVPLVADLADVAAVDGAVQEAVLALGRLDVLAHVAGLDTHVDLKRKVAEKRQANAATPGPAGLDTTLEITDGEWARVMGANLNGTFHCVRAVLRTMIPQRSGAIVTVSSISGVSGAIGNAAHYAAAKAGVIGFTQAVAKDVIGFGIRVNTVAPGAVDTPMQARNPPFSKALLVTPIGRQATAEEIAGVIAFLLGPDAAYIVGETVNVNGGLLMV